MARTKENDETWRDRKMEFEDRLRHVFDFSKFSDVAITVRFMENGILEEKKFQLHSFILKMASPAFERMLDGGSNSHEIIVDDIPPSIFSHLVKYMYFHTVSIDLLSTAWELYAAAMKYSMTHLQKACLDYITNRVTKRCALFVYEKAVFFNVPEIVNQSYKIIQTRADRVLSTPYFLRATEGTVLTILDDPELDITELSLFLRVEKWVRAEVCRLERYYNREHAMKTLCERIVPKFRFSYMSIKDFAEGPFQSDMLSKELKNSVMADLVSKNALTLSIDSEKLVEVEFYQMSHFSLMDCVSLTNDCRISLCFSTMCSSGLILWIGPYNVYENPDDVYISLSLESGVLKTQWNRQEYCRESNDLYTPSVQQLSNSRVDDGKSHRYEIIINQAETTIVLDEFKTSGPPLAPALKIPNATLFVGGLPDYRGFHAGFIGCIARLKISRIGIVSFTNNASKEIRPCYCDLVGKSFNRTQNDSSDEHSSSMDDFERSSDEYSSSMDDFDSTTSISDFESEEAETDDSESRMEVVGF